MKKNLNPLLNESVFGWNQTHEDKVDPYISWQDRKGRELSDTEVDKMTQGIWEGSHNYIAVCRKLLRKYPTKNSMLKALQKLEASIPAENAKRVAKIIQSLKEIDDSDYYKWTFQNLSGDNHPWIRRLFTGIAAGGVAALICSAMGKDSLIGTGIPLGSSAELAISIPGVGVAGTSIASDLRHNYRAKSLYRKTPEEILKWNAGIK